MIYKSLSPNVFLQKNIWWEICKSLSFAKSKTWFTNIFLQNPKHDLQISLTKCFCKNIWWERFVNLSLFFLQISLTKCFCKIQNMIYKSLSPNVFFAKSKTWFQMFLQKIQNMIYKCFLQNPKHDLQMFFLQNPKHDLQMFMLLQLLNNCYNFLWRENLILDKNTLSNWHNW